MRRKILPFILGGALSIAAVAPAAATHQPNAAVVNGLIGVVVQNVLNNSLNDVVDINDSLNNLLQNALQNADILNDLEVRIFDILNNLNVNVSDVEISVDGNNIVVTVLGAGGVIETITLS